MSDQLPGGWTQFSFDISKDAREVFDAALKGVGVGYEPLAVATQPVNGINYCFLCKATPVYPGATPYPARVLIHQPTKGTPHITAIAPVSPLAD